MSGGQRVGLNPVTGETYPPALIGAIAPGTGDPTNGLVTGRDPAYPRGLTENPGMQFAPRFGFAWDVFGNGRTAVRGGFGLFYNIGISSFSVCWRPAAHSDNAANQLRYFHGSLLLHRILFSAGRSRHRTRQQRSESDERQLLHPAEPRVRYSSRCWIRHLAGPHLLWQRNINPIPLGANFLPENADPTNTRVPLAAPFLRPVPGYNDINIKEWASSSNYHSLQVSANRRFARHLQFGASWTWSKSMDYNSADTASVSSLVPVRVWNYGLSDFDRTHVFKVNYLWDLPSPAWNNLPATLVLRGWQVSGITSFVSGAPAAVGLSFVNPIDITGSPSQGARVDVTGDPVLPKSERTFSTNFRTDFSAPSRDSWKLSSLQSAWNRYQQLGYLGVQKLHRPGAAAIPIPSGNSTTLSITPSSARSIRQHGLTTREIRSTAALASSLPRVSRVKCSLRFACTSDRDVNYETRISVRYHRGRRAAARSSPEHRSDTDRSAVDLCSQRCG